MGDMLDYDNDRKMLKLLEENKVEQVNIDMIKEKIEECLRRVKVTYKKGMLTYEEAKRWVEQIISENRRLFARFLYKRSSFWYEFIPYRYDDQYGCWLNMKKEWEMWRSGEDISTVSDSIWLYRRSGESDEIASQKDKVLLFQIMDVLRISPSYFEIMEPSIEKFPRLFCDEGLKTWLWLKDEDVCLKFTQIVNEGLQACRMRGKRYEIVVSKVHKIREDIRYNEIEYEGVGYIDGITTKEERRIGFRGSLDRDGIYKFVDVRYEDRDGDDDVKHHTWPEYFSYKFYQPYDQHIDEILKELGIRFIDWK